MVCLYSNKIFGNQRIPYPVQKLTPFFSESFKGIVRKRLEHKGASYLLTGASSYRFSPPLTSLMITSDPAPKSDIEAGFLQHSLLIQSKVKSLPTQDFFEKKALDPCLLKLAQQVFNLKAQQASQCIIESSKGIQRRALSPNYLPDYLLYRALDIPANKLVFAIEKTLASPHLHPSHLDVFAERIILIPLHLDCHFEFLFWGPIGMETNSIQESFYYSFDPKLPHASLTQQIMGLPFQRKTLHLVVMDSKFMKSGL